MSIVSATRDSQVGGEGADEDSDQEIEYDSCIESDDSCVKSDDECALSSSNEDVGTPFSIELCTCVGCTHSRLCPLCLIPEICHKTGSTSHPLAGHIIHIFKHPFIGVTHTFTKVAVYDYVTEDCDGLLWFITLMQPDIF